MIAKILIFTIFYRLAYINVIHSWLKPIIRKMVKPFMT